MNNRIGLNNEFSQPATGRFALEIFGISIDGEFVNGRLVNGTVMIHNSEDIPRNRRHVRYSGQFNTAGLLHGEGSMEIYGNKYMGRFDNGLLVDGVCIDNNGEITHKGRFVQRGQHAIPRLVSGKHYTPQALFEGIFEHDRFVSGTITHFTGTVYNGLFDSELLTSGALYCKTNGFRATVKINVDRMLESCVVNYMPKICSLSPNQLIMVLCSGTRAKFAHETYFAYLKDFSLDLLLLLNEHTFSNLFGTELIGYQQIIENIKKLNEKAVTEASEIIDFTGIATDPFDKAVDSYNLFNHNRYYRHD